MRRPQTLPAFTDEEFQKAHTFFASRVATMMGRKLEEGDWSYVYCAAKNIPDTGWSNLNIDIAYGALGVEHKMLCVRSKRRKNIKDYCGTTLMHPSATRSIRIPSTDGDPTEVARDVLQQYADLIQRRTQKVSEEANNQTPDMRTGWLLWQESLEEFLYFEEEMLPPNPSDYWAEWKKSGGGARRESINLWVYENNDIGKKRYSITTDAGAKIQPYFDVPPPNDPNLYYFRVQGEAIGNQTIRVWITSTTALLIENVLGTLDKEIISIAILTAEQEMAESDIDPNEAKKSELAKPVLITLSAYKALQRVFNGVSDEHMMELFVDYIVSKSNSS